MKFPSFALLAFLACTTFAQADDTKPNNRVPSWVPTMRKVHEGFDGKEGYVAQLGDSITYSMAFWSPMGWDEPQKYLSGDDGLPKTPRNARWRDVIAGTRDKGGDHGNYSGWKITTLMPKIDGVLERNQPEVAIIMFGTNDIAPGKVPDDYEKNLNTLLDKCLAAHCVPILNTIPPRIRNEKTVIALNEIVRRVAKEKQIPLVDFHAEIVRRRSDDWLGTLISQDGVHPSGGKTNVYTDENMSDCGYALRNWLNFLALRQVYFHVLHTEDL